MRRDTGYLEALRAVPLFSRCDDHELQLIASNMGSVVVEAGVHVMEQGRGGHEMVVIVEGTADVLVDGTVVATLGPGDFFGEVSLLDDGPHTATVVATSTLKADVMSQQEFDAVIDGSPHLAKALLRGLAHRLREADLRLTAS